MEHGVGLHSFLPVCSLCLLNWVLYTPARPISCIVPLNVGWRQRTTPKRDDADRLVLNEMWLPESGADTQTQILIKQIIHVYVPCLRSYLKTFIFHHDGESRSCWQRWQLLFGCVVWLSWAWMWNLDVWYWTWTWMVTDVNVDVLDMNLDGHPAAT